MQIYFVSEQIKRALLIILLGISFSKRSVLFDQRKIVTPSGTRARFPLAEGSSTLQVQTCLK